MINFEQFSQVELRIVSIKSAEKVEGSDKLIKLMVDIGEQQQQIIAGIGKVYPPEELIGRQIVVVANLEPRKLMGLESQGMLLAAHGEEGEPILLMPDKTAPNGSIVG